MRSAVSSRLVRVSAFLRSRSPSAMAAKCLSLTCASHRRNPSRMGTQKSTGYVAVNGTRLYYEQRGTGPALVFIPGGTVESTHFAAVAEVLAGEFRTVTYDRRGNGRSPRGAGRHATSITEQADDVAGLIEALGL